MNNFLYNNIVDAIYQGLNEAFFKDCDRRGANPLHDSITYELRCDDPKKRITRLSPSVRGKSQVHFVASKTKFPEIKEKSAFTVMSTMNTQSIPITAQKIGSALDIQTDTGKKPEYILIALVDDKVIDERTYNGYIFTVQTIRDLYASLKQKFNERVKVLKKSNYITGDVFNNKFQGNLLTISKKYLEENCIAHITGSYYVKTRFAYNVY